MSAEPRHDSLSIPWCPPERCGNRLLIRGGEQSEPKIVSFGQPTERLSTVNEATTGHYDGISTIWNGPPRQWTEAANQRSPYPIGDRRSETRERRWDGVDGAMVNQIMHSIHGHFIHSNAINPCQQVLQGKKTRGIPRRKESQVVDFYCDRRERFSGIRRGSRIKGGACGGAASSVHPMSVLNYSKASAARLLHILYSVCNRVR